MPSDGAQVSGSIAVGGWALDDLEVSRVQIFRDPVDGEPPVQMFIGTAVFIAGARPDVARAYPGYPLKDRAGGAPDPDEHVAESGKRAFRIYAYADDARGICALLGAQDDRRQQCGRDAAVRRDRYAGAGRDDCRERLSELGLGADAAAEDHPDRRVDDSGVVDGVPMGNPTYNLFRSDVAGLFPGLANSGGPVGYRVLDTTALAEGQHTIAWMVTDSGGAAKGIGSRYFSVANSADAQALALASAGIGAAPKRRSPSRSCLRPAISIVRARERAACGESRVSASSRRASRVQRGGALMRRVPANDEGRHRLTLRALERLELALGDKPSSCAGTWAGYLVDDDKLRTCRSAPR